MKNDNKEIKQGGTGCFAKQLMANELTENENTIMIDPQKEYKLIAEQLELAGIFIGRPIEKEKKIILLSRLKLNRGHQHISFGTLGKPSKLHIFKESEFKKELAPENAEIEHYELNGEKFVKMIDLY